MADGGFVGYKRLMQSYTPFRYPGGKARLAEWVVRALRHNGLAGGWYVEPYAGGAGIAMLLLVQEHVNQVVINDVDPGVFAFWRAVKEYPKELMALVRHARLSVEEHARQREIYLNPEGRDVLELGFAALYLNRTSRSGILRGGPIGGKKQDGNYTIGARFNRETLVRQLELISNLRGRISVFGMDAEAFLKEQVPQLPKRHLIYLDPPYFRNARRLYRNYYKAADHARLAEMVKELRSPWVLTYDDCAEVRRLYDGCPMCAFEIGYSANNSTRGTGRELMVWGGGFEPPCPPYATRRVLLKTGA